jgi:DNA-binding response OmpR family regulator
MTKVLIVEDDPATSWPGRQFEIEKYDVLTATDGEAGYNLQHTQNPDLIVLDLMLPRMTGLELCRKLRTEGQQFRSSC